MVLGIYCAGGFGGVVYALAKQINRWENICFIDDGEVKEELSCSVLSFDEFQSQYPPEAGEIVIASGEPAIRSLLFDKVRESGYHLPNLFAPMSSCGAYKSIGEGNVFLDFSYLSGGSPVIGNNNIIMPFALISHNCEIHDHIVVASSANVNGSVIVEDCAYIGSGAIIREGIKIGAEAVVGMGAVVTKDVEENCVVMGIPAEVTRTNQSKRVFKGHGSN